MTEQPDVSSASQAEYDRALALMRGGDHPAAQAVLTALVERYRTAPDTIRQGLAADALCTLAVSQRDSGDSDDALDTFRQTSMLFAYNSTDDARYVAAMADLLAAKLEYERGRAQVSHQLLDHMSLRIMMEEQPRFRALFDEAMAQQNALEREHGFESGAGIRLDRIDIGGDLPAVEPPSPPYRYEKIESKFEQAPHSWELAPAALVVTRWGKSFEIPYDQIARLTLRYAPTRMKGGRYTANVRTRRGSTAEIDNFSFAGIGNFEDKSFNYALLIHGLSLKLAAAERANPKARCEVHGGTSWAGYYASIALCVFALLVVLLTIMVGGPWIALVKVAIIALYAPTMIRWIKRNRPRRGTPAELPPGTVPPLVA